MYSYHCHFYIGTRRPMSNQSPYHNHGHFWWNSYPHILHKHFDIEDQWSHSIYDTYHSYWYWSRHSSHHRQPHCRCPAMFPYCILSEKKRHRWDQLSKVRLIIRFFLFLCYRFLLTLLPPYIWATQAFLTWSHFHTLPVPVKQSFGGSIVRHKSQLQCLLQLHTPNRALYLLPIGQWFLWDLGINSTSTLYWRSVMK